MIRFLLTGQLLAISLLWTLTSPYPLKKYLTILFSVRAIISTWLELLMIAQLFGLALIPIFPDVMQPLISIVGLLIMSAGLMLASWAKLTMKHNWGVPAQHDITQQNQLVTTGPFAFSRNPIYVGLLLFFVGFELTLGSALILLTIPLFLLIRQAITKEEVLLEQYFGKLYHAYRSHVPRFI